MPRIASIRWNDSGSRSVSDMPPSGGTIQEAEVCPTSIHQVEQFKERNYARLASIRWYSSRSRSMPKLYPSGGTVQGAE